MLVAGILGRVGHRVSEANPPEQKNIAEGDCVVGLELLPDFIRTHYEIHEWKHALAILRYDFPSQYQDILDVLTNFRLRQPDILRPGGRKSSVAEALDSGFYQRGWEEKGFDTRVVIDDVELRSPTHKVDCYKVGIGLEVEWNNKDPFFDRDLNNFRLLFDLRAISVGVIITRCDELQQIFDTIGRGSSYGASTTHMSKLLPRIEGGSGGGCPILVFGISSKLYVEGDAL